MTQGPSLHETAIHEAGHVVVARRVRLSISRATIERSDDAHGHVNLREPAWLAGFESWMTITRRQRDWMEGAIMVSLAGSVAQERISNRSLLALGDDAAHDMESAVSMASLVSGSPAEAEAYLEWLQQCVASTLRQPDVWREVELVAAALLDKGTLTGRQVSALLREDEQARVAEMRARWGM